MNVAETSVLAAITDTEQIEVLVSEGLSVEHLPTVEIRRIVEWAFKQYFDSGRKQAPSSGALMEEWGQYISDNEIEMPEEGFEYDTPQWSVGMLKANYIQAKASEFQMDMAKAMADAVPAERITVLAEHADNLATLSLSMLSRKVSVEVREGLQAALDRYEIRAESQEQRGMLFGFPEIDAHTTGIHPGELAVIAAGPKTGKSLACLYICMSEFERGRCATLFTLEMSVEETYDRMACFKLGLDHALFLTGRLPASDVVRIREYIEDVLMSSRYGRLNIIKPEPGQRTPEAMLRMARIHETESLVIDQLTFMEHPSEGKKKRDEVIRDKMHDLKNGLGLGRHEMPCVLAHQINRDGVKAAAKTGFLSMEYLADGAEVERTADMTFGLYQSQVERQAQMMKFQTLAARRMDPKHWYLKWRIAQGRFGVLRELEEQTV